LPSGNPFDVPTGPARTEPVAPSGAVTPKGNPFEVGGNTPEAPSSRPIFARTPTENPIVNALSAGNRFTKHLATGHFGMPTAAEEAADDARLNSVFNQSAAVERSNDSAGGSSALGSMLSPMTPNMHGVGPAALRTGLDATLAIPGSWYGKAAGAGVKLLGTGAKAARPLERFVPQVVKDAAGAAGEMAHAGAEKWGDLTHWGGDAWRKLTPEKYRDAILGSNREGAMEAEEARRHGVNLAKITEGLTEEQRLDAYRIAHGEADVSSSPAVNAAAKQLRTHLNDKYFLKADVAGRKRVAMGSPTVANANLRDLSRAKPPAPPKPFDPFEEAVPEDAFGSMPRHPDLPSSGRLPSTLKSINRASPALQKTYELPENLREFTPPANQGILGPLEYKKHYLPGNRGAPEIDPAERPKPYNRLFPNAPEANPQRPYKIGPGALDAEGKSKVASMDEVLAKSNKGTAKQTSAARLRAALGVKPGAATSPDDPLMKLFTETPRATGPARNLTEKIQSIARVPADAARARLIALGLVHGAKNVPTLAGMSEPKALGSMFADAFKTMRMTPEQKWEAQRAAREAGVLGAPMEHDNPVLRIAGKMHPHLRTGAGALYGGYRGQDLENQMNPEGNLAERIAGGVAGAGIGGVTGRFLPQIGKGVGGWTQAMDDAGKVGVHAAKMARGAKPAEAAMQTLRETVDYGHQTPGTRFLQDWGLTPFAQFATKVPGAITRSVARDPRKLILADRLSGGLLTQGTIDLPNQPPRADGKPAQFSMNTPISETVKAYTDPGGYVRTKSSDLAKAAASIASAALGGNVGNAFTGTDRKGKRDPRALYPTHGQPLLPHKNKLAQQKAGFLLEALGGLAPFGLGHEALDASGTDEYQRESPLSQLIGPTIGGYIR
jgi:hypothetical protein